MALKQHYNEKVKKELSDKLEIKNIMAVPAIKKVVVNMGTGDTLRNSDIREKLVRDFSAMTGQKPKIQAARISVAGFNVREGQPVGLTATLRGERMYSFLEKLISVVLPKLRDFRGIPLKSFDTQGNYTLGMAEHTMFPEVDITKIDKPYGLEITIVTSAKTKESARELLTQMGMPFEKSDN